MSNYKYILAAGTALLIPNSVFADTCATLPDCTTLGFKFTASECGTMKKLKCPFGDKYFCSKTNCPTAQTPNSYETCTKYCDDDPTVCIAKDYKSCSDAIRSKNGTMVSNASNISSIISTDLYLMDNISVNSSVTFNAKQKGVSIYDAGERFSVCKTEMAGKTASLTLDSISSGSEGSINFYTPTTIKAAGFSQNKIVSLFFNNSTEATITAPVETGSTYHSPAVYIYINPYGYYDDVRNLKYKIKIKCGNEYDYSWDNEQCSSYGSDSYCQVRCLASIEGVYYDSPEDTKICIASNLSTCSNSTSWHQMCLIPPRDEDCNSDGYDYAGNGYRSDGKYYNNCKGKITTDYSECGYDWYY